MSNSNGVRLPRCFAAAAILVVLTCAHAMAQDCTLKRIASIPMIHPAAGGIVVPATIDGAERKLYVSPGDAFGGIYEQTARDLDLRIDKLDSVDFYTYSGQRLDHYVNVPSFSMGGVGGEHLRFLLAKGDGQTSDLAGWVGKDILKSFDLDFDFAAMKVNLFSPDHCPGKVVYWSRDYAAIPYHIFGGAIQIPVTLDGHDMRADLRLSNEHTHLEAAQAYSFYGIDEHSPGAMPVAGAKPDDLVRFRYRFKSLSMDGVAISNALVSIIRSEIDHAYARDEGKAANYFSDFAGESRMSIGLDVLSKLHLYIAYGEQKIYLTAADAGQPAAKAP